MPVPSPFTLPLEMYEVGPVADARTQPEFDAARQPVWLPGEQPLWGGPTTRISFKEGPPDQNMSQTWQSSLADDWWLILTNRRVIYRQTNISRGRAGVVSGAVFGVVADAASGLVNRHRMKDLVLAGHVPIASVLGVALRAEGALRRREPEHHPGVPARRVPSIRRSHLLREWQVACGYRDDIVLRAGLRRRTAEGAGAMGTDLPRGVRGTRGHGTRPSTEDARRRLPPAAGRGSRRRLGTPGDYPRQAGAFPRRWSARS
jgi:hypothetical protein